MSARLLVVDASVVVELLRGSELGDAVATTLRGATLAAPAHLDDSRLARSAAVPVETLPAM